MAGTFIEGVSKILSGVYSLIKGAASYLISGSTRGVVAYPFTADWGPTNALKTVESNTAFRSLYNADSIAEGLTASKIFLHAYKGLPRKLKAYRMATATEAKGTLALKDDEDGNSLKLETLYPSARAFVVTVTDGVAEGSKKLQLIEAGNVLFSCTSTSIAAMAAEINESKYLRVQADGLGTKLPKNVSAAPFTGGNNGAPVTATQYDAFLTEVEGDGDANAFALDTCDPAILATVKAWVRAVREDGLYLTFVMGGPAIWEADQGLANAASIEANSRAIVNVGNGCDGYAPYEMAIFVAARVASVGLNETLTDEVVPYGEVNTKYKKSVRELAKQSGTVLFVKVGDTVELDEGVNTLTTPSADESKEFGKIRVSNALDAITKDLEAFGNEYKRTKSNSSEARQAFATAIEEEYLKKMAGQNIIQTGYYYKPDPDYHGPNPVRKPAIDEAFFVSDITPVDSMERIYQKIGVSF